MGPGEPGGAMYMIFGGGYSIIERKILEDVVSQISYAAR